MSPPSRSRNARCRTPPGATWPGCCGPSTTHPERTWGEDLDDATEQRAYRAGEWSDRNRDAFLTAYAGRDLSADERTLLEAYVADKAVYETVYETRNRPAWVGIPLAAVARIGVS